MLRKESYEPDFWEIEERRARSKKGIIEHYNWVFEGLIKGLERQPEDYRSVKATRLA